MNDLQMNLPNNRALRQGACRAVSVVVACLWLGALILTGCSDTVGGNVVGDATGVADTGTMDVSGSSGDGRTDASAPGGPPYPVVLAHGFAGFDHLVDRDTVPYFFGVHSALEDAGETVFVGEVDPFNDSSRRGEQLLDQIEAFLARSAKRKVNIIGHSQGGLDARYVAHQRPDLVASVVTISTPHRGTMVADIVLDLVDHDLARDVIDELVRLLGKPLYNQAGEETSLFDAFEQMSERGMSTFNEEISDADSVYYASIAGRSDGHRGRTVCQNADAPSFVREWKDETDPIDPLLELAEDVLDGTDDDPHANDGLVRVTSAKWGEFLGCIPADHLDEVGQLLGDSPGKGNEWEHIQFYRDLVAYLHQRGM